MTTSLPPGWLGTTLGGCATARGGRAAPDPSDDGPYLSLDGVESHTGRILRWERAGDYASSAAQIEPGDVVYSRLRPYLNKVCVSDRRGVGSAELIVLKPLPHASSRFLALSLRSPDFVRFANGLSSGDRPRVNWGQIQDYPMALPPLPEQEEIVLASEKYFDRLDFGTASLARAERNAKGLLRSAARLTRAESLFPTRPFGEVTRNFDGMRVPVKASDREARNGPYPYYGASGVIDSFDAFIFDGRFLLIGEDGANLLARSKPIAFEAVGRFWVNNHAHVVQTIDEVRMPFLRHYINALDLTPYVTGSAQPKLTQRNLNSIPVPVPPLHVQDEIVRAIDTISEVADRLLADLRAAGKRSDSLRTGVLRAAVNGRLPSVVEL